MVFECPFKHIKANSLPIFQLKLFFSFDFSLFFVLMKIQLFITFLYIILCVKGTQQTALDKIAEYLTTARKQTCTAPSVTCNSTACSGSAGCGPFKVRLDANQQVVSLDLEYNELTKLPTEIGYLSSLTMLFYLDSIISFSSFIVLWFSTLIISLLCLPRLATLA